MAEKPVVPRKMSDKSMVEGAGLCAGRRWSKRVSEVLLRGRIHTGLSGEV